MGIIKPNRRVLCVVMDGVGLNDSDFGNAVAIANTPHLDALAKNSVFASLRAHGTYVGLPSNSDIGNSEVGHNAIGAGRVFDQGAKLVDNAVRSGDLFRGDVWNKITKSVVSHGSTLHFIGLLSDGNVHSHESHLYGMMREAKKVGVNKIRIHPLLDGRDVGEKTAEKYVANLEQVIRELNDSQCDIKVASGGGRMTMTMDRYGADWPMVQRGWSAHVDGKADHTFESLTAALDHFRHKTKYTDQNIPAFVIGEGEKPAGTINDGDGVIFFNFRGDRSIEISRAFTEPDFNEFDRGRVPQVEFAGMMEYDGDLHIPNQYLVDPPAIDDTLGEYMASLNVSQFACSETQKFGHVTFFWNGNRSGKFNPSTEDYVEVPSDNVEFNCKPWMKAYEITNETVDRIRKKQFDFGRINFANGDMVGHTGDLEASVIAVSTVDLMIGRLVEACRETDTILMVTADHGNCDEMFDCKEPVPDWRSLNFANRPKPKTSHTLNPVPFYLFDPVETVQYRIIEKEPSIANVASTVLAAMGLPSKPNYLPPIVELA